MNNCPICKNEKVFVRWKDKKYKVYKCSICYVNFLSPIPEEIEKLYDERYFKNWYIKFYNSRKDYLDKLLKKISIPEKCKILDIGCGVGIFMDLMKKKGNEVYGQDISNFALNFCKEKGFKVYNSLSEIDSEEKFDVITMMDVIAHIKNPVDYLQKCKKFLKCNGILIIKTPLHSNYLFFIAKILKLTGKSKSILHLPVQIYHFDKYAISNLGKLVNLKIKKIMIVKEFINKKITLLNLWKLLGEKSMVVILKNE